VGRRGLFAIPLSLLVAACSSDAADSKGPEHPQPSSSVSEEAPRRVALTLDMIDKYQLTADDLTQLQVYVHGKILLRRGAGAGGREITEHHTLRVLEGREYDEVLVGSGTPGAVVDPSQIFVNFDPGEPDAGLVFEPTDSGRFVLKSDEAEPRSKTRIVEYAGADYEVVTGAATYLEIEKESLKELEKRQHVLPGTVLPGSSAEQQATPDAPPSAAPSSSPPPEPAK
jgi:hypothetical protein